MHLRDYWLALQETIGTQFRANPAMNNEMGTMLQRLISQKLWGFQTPLASFNFADPQLYLPNRPIHPDSASFNHPISTNPSISLHQNPTGTSFVPIQSKISFPPPRPPRPQSSTHFSASVGHSQQQSVRAASHSQQRPRGRPRGSTTQQKSR